MRSAGLHLREILRRAIFIGFGIQILLGISWMVCALARTDSLGDRVLCLLRFALAWAACVYFLRGMDATDTTGCRRLWRIVYNGLGLATFPMAMQCHMEADGNSVPTSLLLLAVACVVRLVRSDAARSVRKADRLLLCGLAVIAGGSVLYGATARTEVPGTWMASRFAWSTLAEAEKDWPEELTEAADGVNILTASYYPEELERTMVPELVEKLGTDGATDFLRQIAVFALKNDPARVAKDIAWDAAGYALSPIVLQLQLTGRAYESLSGRNYEELLRVQPALGKAYMDYGCKWYMALLGLTILLWAVDRFSRGNAPKKMRLESLAGLLTWLTAAILIAYCTMRRGGLMDYRHTVYVIYLVLAKCLLFSDRSVIEREQEHGKDA